MSITIEIADLTLPSLPATTTGSNDAQVHGDEQRSETSANEAVPEVSAPVECERSIKRSNNISFLTQKSLLAKMLFKSMTTQEDSHSWQP
jgi:hypothetical protein